MNRRSNLGALSIYKTKILPYFDYGDVLYRNSDTRNTTKLQRLQNRALRICLEADARTHVSTLHNLANLPELGAGRCRRVSHIRIFAYNRSKIPIYVMKNHRPTRSNEATQVRLCESCNSYKYKYTHHHTDCCNYRAFFLNA